MSNPLFPVQSLRAIREPEARNYMFKILFALAVREPYGKLEAHRTQDALSVLPVVHQGPQILSKTVGSSSGRKTS